MKKFTNHTFPFETGDCVYMFTDGYADQFDGPDGKKYMYGRFKKKLIEIHQRPMPEQRIALLEDFETWKGPNEQIDDVCVFGIRL